VEPAAVAALAVLVVLLGGTTLWLYGAYNSLLGLRRLVDRTWEQVDDELRRRHDLVPNLLAVVRERTRPADPGSAAAVDAVAAALAAARAAGPSVPERADAERVLSQALEGVFGVADRHPALRAEESYLALRRELTDIQSRATAARRLYNANVSRLDARQEGFPAGVLARLVGVRHAEAAGSLSADPRTAGIDVRGT
jgi:LemA protein